MNKFAVYKHQFSLPSGTIARRQLIVLKHDDGTMTFTTFGKYIGNSKAYKTPDNDGGPQFYYVVQMLNFALHEHHIRSLNDLTVDMVRDFLTNYASGTLGDDDCPRQKNTVIACSNAIMNFLVNYIQDNKKASIKESELYKTELCKNKYNKIEERKVPVFDVIVDNISKTTLRDIPNKAFALLLNHIADDHPELLGLVILCSFAGLRPSEACNVKRENSPLGAGIIFHTVNGNTKSIKIDLRKEQILRSDGVMTGGIKKPRVQPVPAMFIDSFTELYKHYMKYLKDRPYEEDFGAFSINKQGRAITYRSFFDSFKRIVKEEMIPIYLSSDDPELIKYGRILMEYDLAPHSLRHWYSVQLTLAGCTIPELMNARGDTSPESALTYLQNKGELEKQYSEVAEKSFDYMKWLAGKTYGTK